MSTQLELPAPLVAPVPDQTPLFRFDEDHPNVHWMLDLLKGGWMTRRAIIAAAGRALNEQNQRWVRALASAAGGRIVKGQSGFCHIDRATAEEIRAAINQRRDQISAEQRYVIALEREYHRRIG